MSRTRTRSFLPLITVASCMVGVVTAFPTVAYAQEALRLPRLTGPVILDGMSAEPAWAAAASLPVIMYDPVYGGSPTERTEIRVGHDDHYLFVAARLYDSYSPGIRANSLYRDRWSGDDVFGVLLDTFHDRDNALHLWTTPTGIRGDEGVSADGNAFNSSWNGHWEVAAARTADGWFVELRIPFSTLGFREVGGEVEMGFTAYRYIARKNERHVYPAISQHRDILTPSQAAPVSLSGVRGRRPLYVTPYALGGLAQTAELTDDGAAYRLAENVARDLGLDLKFNLTGNLTLDLTANTDFAQVEADNQQVNLTRFSLFFPEKRQFFQERAGLFHFPTLRFGSDRLFHSRRIGLHEGQNVPIIGGARVVGRIGEWDVGWLDMQTAAREALGAPSENFGVLRLRRRVVNPYSYAGALVTTRLDEDGGYNVAYGLDAVVRVFGDDYLTVRVTQTVDDSITAAGGFDLLRSALGHVGLERRRNIGLNYGFSIARGGPEFQPAAGFVTRRDFTELGWAVSYDMRLGEQSTWRTISPAQLLGFILLRNPDGTVETALFEYDLDFEWKSGASVSADFEIHHENLREPLAFPGNTEVPAGSHTFFRHEGGFDMPSGHLLRAGVDWGIAQFYDGWRVDLGFQPTWNASRHLELGAEYEVSVIRFPSRDQGVTAHVLRARAQAAANTRMSATAFVQYNSAAATVAANVRLRYNIREGNDLWVVYNEGLNTDRGRFAPALPLTQERTALVKYTHTLIW